MKIKTLLSYLFLAAAIVPASAQWQVPLNAVPLGRGQGSTGFRYVGPGGAGTALISNGTTWLASALPAIQSLSGGTGITVTSGGTNWTVALSNQLTAGSVGSGSRIPVLTFNAQGQLTVATDIAASVAPFVTLSDYNIICDGVTDWHTQLQSMLNSGAKEVYLPYQTGDCLTSVTLNLPSNIRINGAGESLVAIRGTFASGPVFNATNKSNIRLENFSCKGSQAATSWAVTNYGCLVATQSSTITQMNNISLKNMTLSGFNANYWVFINAVSGNAAIQSINNVDIINVTIASTAGDSPNDPTPSNNGAAAIVLQTGSLGGGGINNVRIHDNFVSGFYICTGFLIYGNVRDLSIQRNLVRNVGYHINTLGPTHCINGSGDTFLSYATAVYDIWSDGNPPFNGIIANNIWDIPYAAGLYTAGDGDPTHTAELYNNWNFSIHDNLTYNQTDDKDASLPRAAIVVNGPMNTTVSNNRSYGGFGGVSVGGVISAGELLIQGNDCYTGRASGFSTVSCIKLSSGVGVANTGKIFLKGNTSTTLTASGAATVLMVSSAGARFNTVEMSGGTINAAFSGLTAVTQYVTNSFTIEGVKFGGTATNWMASVGDNTGAPVVVKDSIFDSADGVAGYGLLSQTGTIHIQNVKFVNRTSGAVPMIRLDGGTCGTIKGVTFSNVIATAQSYSSGLGTTNPSACTLNYLDEVQNLLLSELGSGGYVTANQKYVIPYWLHASTTASTTHLGVRFLTGN